MQKKMNLLRMNLLRERGRKRLFIMKNMRLRSMIMMIVVQMMKLKE